MKKLMRGLITGLAGLTLAGCGIYTKPSEVSKDFSVYPEWRVGVDAFYTKANVSKQLRTTGPHPDDPFLSGDTTTGNPSGVNVALKVGAVASAGTPDFRVYAGGDVRYGGHEIFSATEDRKQQISDTREPQFGSYAFTQLLQLYTAMPVLGIEKVLGDFTVRAEVGLPYSWYQVRSGHDRYNKFEQVQQDRWDGWGQHVRADFLYKVTDNWSAGLSVGYEHFKAEFGGEKSDIESFLGFLQFEYKLAK